MSDMNVYYYPEKHDLVKLLEFEQPDMSYEFNTFVVWHHKDGRVFFASDSGCSCPTPFENYVTIESLNEVRPESLANFESALNSWRKGYSEDKPFISAVEVGNTVSAVRTLLGMVGT